MRKLLIFSALLCASFSSAQTIGITNTAFTISPTKIAFQSQPGPSWSGSAFYDIAGKHFCAVAFNRIGDLTHNGKSTGIEANGFVGAANVKGAPSVIGFAAVWHRRVFDQIQVVFGFGVSLTGGKVGGGPILGAAIQF